MPNTAPILLNADQWLTDPSSPIFQVGTAVSVETGRVLFEKGDSGSSFFVVIKGLVELRLDGDSRRLIHPGDFFGEIAALAGIPRTATARCLTTCHLVELSAENLRLLLKQDATFRKVVTEKYRNRLFQSKTRKNKSMFWLNEGVFDEILSFFRPINLKPNEFLFHQDDAKDDVYFILQGHLSIVRNNRELRRCGPGEIIGEIGAIYEMPRTASVQALDAVELLACDRLQLDVLLSHFPVFENYLKNLAKRRLSDLKIRVEERRP